MTKEMPYLYRKLTKVFEDHNIYDDKDRQKSTKVIMGRHYRISYKEMPIVMQELIKFGAFKKKK
jgi:hypothetical protein